MAHLIANSTLLKSYESIVKGLELELDKKTGLLRELERDLQQLQAENTHLSQQVYNLKFNQPAAVVEDKDGATGLSGILGANEKNSLVDLLKRNHDVVLEKYETLK